ncbi:MAG TPA: hypothetical protein VGH63_16150 [Polyangia bacterium]|jgi:hypothetical protein
MLLNALTAPEVQEATSAYVRRSGEAAGIFLYFVAGMAAVIFVVAALASLRTPTDSQK